MILDLMRRKAQSPVLQGTILIIVLVFIFWGVGSDSGNRRITVSTVNGEEISYPEYQKAYEELLNMYREQFGGQVPEELLKTLNLKEKALEQLEQRLLLRQAVSKAGLMVSKQEVQNTIVTMEAFQLNGAFDKPRYDAILSSSKTSPSNFEAGIHDNLLGAKIMAHTADFAPVADKDLQERFNYDYGEVKVDYLKFSPDEFKAEVKPTDEALAEFFKAHEADYKTEPQIKLKYIPFFFADQEKDIEIPAADIEQYYKLNQDKYNLPEKRNASHILIRVDENADEKQVAAKRQQIDEVLAKAKAGEDFAALAKKYSEDSSAANGGELGFFAKGQMVGPFEEAAFKLKTGEISEVVQSKFGFHIIKLAAIQAASSRSLEEARPEIVTTLKQEKSKNLTFTLANQAYEKIILAGSLEKFGESNQTAIKESPFFSRQAPPAELAADFGIITKAFSLRQGELSSLLKGTQGYFILYVLELKNPEVPPLAAVKEKLSKDFIADRSRTLASEAATALLESLKKGEDFTAALAKLKKKAVESDYISRQKKTGLPASVADLCFNLSAQRPYPETVGQQDNDYYVIRFRDKKEAQPEQLAEKREEIKKQLQAENKEVILTAWLAFLRDRAEIERDEKYLN